MLVESTLLALGGGLFGLLLCLWATSALSAFHLPIPLPIDLAIGIDWKVLFHTSALSIGTGLMIGIVPALAASRPILSRALKGEEAFADHRRRWSLQNVLVLPRCSCPLCCFAPPDFFCAACNARPISISASAHAAS
ncbi:MAG: hypothetical protein WA869_16705 [Alloacidobacterium sp.]